MKHIFCPDYSFYTGLPKKELLFNPLTDIPLRFKEDSELTEFYKLGNEYYSPLFGIKYLLNVNLFPFQGAIILALLNHKFPLLVMSRGSGKTYLLAVFALYYAVMNPGTKIVLISAGFRQAKLIFGEIKKIYEGSPLLRALSSKPPSFGIGECHYEVNESSITALPLGQGDKIRGQRSHLTLVDEFNSLPIEVFDVVVRGFSATEADPWKKVRGLMLQGKSAIPQGGNKIVLSGTAGFKGETLYRMYKQYSMIIGNRVRGEAKNYSDLLGDDFDGNEHIDFADYCIIKLKYTEVPIGMMDMKMIHHARTTMPKMLFDMEYNGLFADDTAGFFKARNINDATSRPPDGFSVEMVGKPNRQYVMGVDPARTTDRAAIQIIQLGSPHKTIFAWSCQNQKYSFIAEKIRDLLRRFKNVIGIAMDRGGGGLAIEELLQSQSLMKEGDKKLYRFDDDTAEAKTGNRMLYMVAFDSLWLDESNALLQKNIEDKTLMFPMPISIKDSYVENSDEIDDAIFEIQELKKELTSIEVTYTKSGKRHYDLMPADLRTAPGESPRHKDRYSALLLANYLASRYTALQIKEPNVLKDYYKEDSHGGYLEDFGEM